MPDPVLDPSTPCCTDVSKLLKQLAGCPVGPKSGPGGTGGMSAPATGTFSNTLNATNGGSGGASGSSWSLPDEPVTESWL